ncbi:MAG: enoyl-CoA hydratase/isomerase family protein [Syntrophobacteraceae bacterium]
MAKPVTVTIAENIATVLLNRPQAYNAFDLEFVESLAQHMTSLAADRNIRAVIISGEGKAFCAGGDLKYILSLPQGPSAGFHELAARFHQAVLEIRRMPKPVIAAINGAAAGAGFSLALACDFRVMAKSAFLRQAYTSNGLSIDGGGSFVLPRLVGLGRALEIMAFDRPISSEQAMAWGLVTKVVEDEDVIKEATEMARELASGSSASFGWSKRLLTDSFDSSFETQIEREREGLSACAGTAEGTEGLKAFSEKRKPVFTSR